MTTITLSELPETLQNLLQQIAQTGETLTITQNDQPLLIVSPAPKTTRAAFGSAKDTGKIISDIVEPTSKILTQTFQDLRDQVSPVDSNFDPDQAKTDYLTQKHSL